MPDMTTIQHNGSPQLSQPHFNLILLIVDVFKVFGGRLKSTLGFVPAIGCLAWIHRLGSPPVPF